MADAEKNIYERLALVQSKLKAPKSQTNSFGGYFYRSCEDILEAVKPILKEYNLTLTLSDDVVEIGGRVYVKALASLFDADDVKDKITVNAFAREAQNKKGMDDGQITGATSSYARKYALNGLFCIDDTKDDDTDEQRIEREKRYEEELLDLHATTIEQLQMVDTMDKYDTFKKKQAMPAYRKLRNAGKDTLAKDLATQMQIIKQSLTETN
jgi:hypothetical protein